MKNRELAILVGFAILIIMIEKIFHLSTWFVVVVFSFFSFLQMVYYERKITMNFKSEVKSYRYKLEGTEKDRQQIASRLDTVFSSIPFPLVIMDTYGKLVLANKNFDIFLNRQVNGELDYNDISIDFEVRMFLKETYLTERPITRNINHNNIDYQCYSVPMFEGSRFSGSLLTFQDITVAVEKERLQKRFIADASHELRTPIAAIRGMIEILNRDDFDDQETLVEFHQQIEKEANRLERLVLELLQLSRLSSGRVILQKEACDIEGLIENSIKEIQNALKPNVEIVFFSTGSYIFSIDGNKMQQVLSNLIRNACLHSGASQVNVSLKTDEQQVVISVQDDGCGIDEKHLENIFERFYRVDSHRARTTGGSGLGLAIVKSIVIAHEGDVEVVSEIDEGTCFTIKIPTNRK